MWKKLMIGALGLLVCGMVMGATPSGPPLLCDAPGNVVYSGVVIAYGEWVDPPFHVFMDADQLVLNGFVFSPRPMHRRVAARKISISAAQLKRHELIESISEMYVDVYYSKGKEAAHAQVIETFGTDEFILSMRFEGKFLVIEFADNHVEWMNMTSHVDAASERAMIAREIVEARTTLASDLTEILQSGRAIVFGYDYTIYISHEIFGELTRVIDTLLRHKIDYKTAEIQWVELLGEASRSFFADVKEHLESWERR
jgi:hypothetical protein